jgi:plasmid stabilization system protein ParE
MKLSFDPKARDDLDAIFAYIAQGNPAAATRFMERIEERVKDLA